MRMTQEADYALRMMCLLAKRAGDGTCTVGAATLAEGVAVPARFGLKILRKLSDAQLVKASRGAAGGYSLCYPPTAITVRQVVEAIDGPITVSRCLSDTYLCLHNPDKDGCRLHHVFEELSRMLAERLERLTLAMVVDQQLGLEELLSAVRTPERG